MHLALRTIRYTVHKFKLRCCYSTGVIKSPYKDISLDKCSVNEQIWQNIHKWPDHTALVCGVTGRKYTYSEFEKLTKRFAASTRRLGLKPKDVLAIMLPNIPEYPIILLGAVEASIVVTTINPLYTPREISHQLSDSGAIIVVTLPSLVTNVLKAQKLISDTKNKEFSLSIVVVNFTSDSTPAGCINYKELVADTVEINFMVPPIQTDDMSFLPYSSGTTGLSKGVQLTHDNLVRNIRQFSCENINQIRPTIGNYQDVLPCVLPFFHIYGLVITLLRPLSDGLKLVVLSKFEPSSFLSALKDHKSTVLYIVPPIVIYLGANPHVKPEHLETVRWIVNGAGPVAHSDADRVVHKCSSNSELRFIQAYGLTETSPAVFVSDGVEPDYKTVGNAVPSTLIKVLKEDGTSVTKGELGEICCKGPQVMKGYHNNVKATQEAMDEEGFFHTGDVGYYNEKEQFYIVERSKELIKVKGFQVPPAELEGILRDHPKVLECGVIGIPDDRSGEVPLAFVVTKEGTTVSEQELQNFVADKVAPFKRLTGGVKFVKDIPKSQTGKILRRLLREQVVSK